MWAVEISAVDGKRLLICYHNLCNLTKNPQTIGCASLKLVQRLRIQIIAMRMFDNYCHRNVERSVKFRRLNTHINSLFLQPAYCTARQFCSIVAQKHTLPFVAVATVVVHSHLFPCMPAELGDCVVNILLYLQRSDFYVCTTLSSQWNVIVMLCFYVQTGIRFQYHLLIKGFGSTPVRWPRWLICLVWAQCIVCKRIAA